jgi:integrase
VGTLSVRRGGSGRTGARRTGLAPEGLPGRCAARTHPSDLKLDDYAFTVEVEHFVSQYERVRRRKDPKVPASEQALWRMVRRVCKRAGVRVLSPHQLRHGFVNRFLRESGRDVAALRPLLGHSRIDTPQLYTDEIELDELKAALDAAYRAREGQASPDWATLDLSTLKYPRNRFMEAAGIEPASAAAPAERLQA